MNACQKLFLEPVYNEHSADVSYKVSKTKLLTLSLVILAIGLAILSQYAQTGAFIEDKAACYFLGLGIDLSTTLTMLVACFCAYKAYGKYYF